MMNIGESAETQFFGTGQFARFANTDAGTESAVEGTVKERERDRMMINFDRPAVGTVSGGSAHASRGSSSIPYQVAVSEAIELAMWNGSGRAHATGTAIAESSARSSGATRTFSQG
jgi:hypothetical protein